MTRFLGYVVAGLANGTIYALVALGVVVIYRISRVVNLAHGAMGVFATFCFYYVFIGDWGLPVAAAFVLTLLSAPAWASASSGRSWARCASGGRWSPW